MIVMLSLVAVLLIAAAFVMGGALERNLQNVRFGQRLFSVHPVNGTIACEPATSQAVDAAGSPASLSANDPFLYGPRIAQYYQRQGQQDRADEWWTALDDCQRCLATVWFERGMNAQGAGDSEAALSAYERAAARPAKACDTVGDSDALYQYASLIAELQQDDWQTAALANFQEAIVRNDFTDYEEYVDSRYQVGRLLFLQRRDADAAQVLLDLLQERPEHSWANMLLGRIYARSEDQRNLAREYLTRAVETSADSVWRPMYYLGLYELDNGNAADAITWLEKALDQNPDDSRIREALQRAREAVAAK